ncbi:MAG: glycosyltransferase [Planctomycetota bacterium]
MARKRTRPAPPKPKPPTPAGPSDPVPKAAPASAPQAMPDMAPATPSDPPPPASPTAPADPVDARSRRSTGRAGKGRRAEPLLVESAWEVCNKLGGIYTVLRSKAPSMMSRWGSRYGLVGPYIEGSAQVEMEPCEPHGPFGRAAEALREQGVGVEFGRWLISGRPPVALIRLDALKQRLGDIRYRLWADHQVPTHDGDALADNVLAFGEGLRLFLWALAVEQSDKRGIIAHLHEWMAGPAIPMLRHEHWPGSLVFTTHATLLGRYLASNHPVFYDHLPFFNSAEEAKRYNIEPQHGIERAAAHGSHVFTTVSDVTGRECEHLLGRKPDVILPNGLNIERFAAIHEFQNLHQEYKGRVHEFTMGHFFPSYHFDLDSTLYFFTSGRYEYRNKGMDVTLEALARLNWRLKQSQSQVTVVFFIITRAPVKSIQVGALQSRAMLQDLKETSEVIKAQIGDRIFHAAAAGRIPDLNALVDERYRLRLRRSMQAWRRNTPPPIVTHDLVDDAKDPVLCELRRCSLFNEQHDPVKVIFHPDFISSTNPLFGVDYDQFVRGCHLGVFPSYYEPWGYTPLECAALGVPSITSDLSGFGSYLKDLMPDHNAKGMYVVERDHRDFGSTADQLADQMYRFCQLARRERIELRNKVEAAAELFDWHTLGRKYHEAHRLALERA